jgi:hypothetical protein
LLECSSASTSPLWAPKTLCHQAIFVDHTSGAVAPPDAEVVRSLELVTGGRECGGLLKVAEVAAVVEFRHLGVWDQASDRSCLRVNHLSIKRRHHIHKRLRAWHRFY